MRGPTPVRAGSTNDDGPLIAPLYPLPLERFADPRQGRYDVSTMQTRAPTTWEDVLRMPDDGNRYEFIGGRLYMTPAPVTRHQRVLGRLWSALGAPDLVVEILSPTTAHRDRGIKLDLYARHGVQQYWIVDPREDVVDVWRFADDPGRERFSRELPVRLGSERSGLIDLDEVFSRHLDLWEEGD